jgi:putative flippase GtrA
MNPLNQFFRFAGVGLLVTALHVAITVFLVEYANTNPVQANVVAFICATLTGLVLNSRWSFSRVLSARIMVRYLVVTTLGLLLTIAINVYCAQWGIRYEMALFLVVSSVPLLSFMLHRNWTYRSASQGA